MASSRATQDHRRGKDDRGRPTTLLDPYTYYLHRRYDSIPADVLRQIARDLGSGFTRAQRVFFILGALCVVAGAVSLLVYLVRVIRAGRLVFPLPLSLLLLNLWTIPFVFWLLAGQRRAGRIRRVMMAHRRCPHCGYDLRGLPSDPADGATVCPECGLAWRLHVRPNGDPGREPAQKHVD